MTVVTMIYSLQTIPSHRHASDLNTSKPRRAQSAFDAQRRKRICVTFDKSNKTPASPEKIYYKRNVTIYETNN